MASGGQLQILFVRHGQTQDNIERVLQGHRDTSLTEQGLQEAEVLGEKLRDQQMDILYTSPLIRMQQTIQPILKSHPNLRKELDPDLKGQGLGELEGMSYDQVDFGNPRDADVKPGVEKFDDFVRRLKRFTARMMGKEAPQVGDKDRVVVIATHGVVVTSIFKALESTTNCAGFNPPLATRGPQAYEVRWTDSDDVAKMVVEKPAELPIKDGVLDWDKISEKPFLIERWGKKEKAL